MRSMSACILASLLAFLLTACGVGAEDRLTIVGTTEPALLDAEVTSALSLAGVVAVPAPPAEAPALVALGRALFFDKVLSGDRNISCATCHHPAAGTGDALPLSLGTGGQGLASNRVQGTGSLIARNAPPVFNAGVAAMRSMFWDSRVQRDASTGALMTPVAGLNGAAPALAAQALPLSSALAAQAMFPVTAREEMRGQSDPLQPDDLRDAADEEDTWTALMARLVGVGNGSVGGIAAYRTLFSAAYPSIVDFDQLTFGHAARAIAAFERETWTALDTPLDRYLAGDTSALSTAAKRGAKLFFGSASCSNCHDGPLLSDLEHHAICVPQVGPGKNAPGEDLGLSLQTGSSADDYKFRTPPLRNVALTAPYMHDGAFVTLEDAVRHHLDPLGSLSAYDATTLPALFQPTYDADAGRNLARADALDPLLPGVTVLSDAEFADLMAFLHALTDPSSLAVLADIPDEVPSGLPVKD